MLSMRARCIIVAALALPGIFLQGCSGSSSEGPVERGHECAPSHSLDVFRATFLWDRGDKGCLCDTENANFKKNNKNNNKEQHPSGGVSITAYSYTFDYSVLDTVLVKNWPMIHSHDAGTGYDATSNICYEASVATPATQANWAVTQVGGLKKQLECGARAFDLRLTPNPDDGNKLMYVHGSYVVANSDFKDSLTEVISWADSNPKELVILFTKPRAGSATRHLEILRAEGIHYMYPTQCATLAGYTLAQAKDAGKLGGDAARGKVIAASHNCGNEGPYGNYDTNIICHKQNEVPTPLGGYSPLGAMANLLNVDSCYDDDQGELRSNFWKYTKRVTSEDAKNSRTETAFWMVQAHWQYTAASIFAGSRDAALVGGACILNDVKSTCINLGFAANIRNGDFKHGLNLIDVDYVCHHGKDLFAAIKEYVNSNYFKDFIPSR